VCERVFWSGKHILPAKNGRPFAQQQQMSVGKWPNGMAD